MIAFIWAAWYLVALVEGQDEFGAAPKMEQECVLLITSSLFVCEDEDSKSYLQADGLQTVRFNETVTYITGHISILKNVDKKTRSQAVIYKMLNGGNKEMIFTHDISLCEELENEEGELRELLKYTDLPTECPIEAGTYSVYNLVANVDSAPINTMNIGKYEAVVNLFTCKDEECKERTFECCAKLDVEIEPLE